MPLVSRDVALAVALARVGLGINIAIHGVARLPHVAGFVAETEKSFAATFLPASSVALTAFLIPPSELVIGVCLILGLFQRAALVLGSLLMIQLTFGTALLQQWQVAGIQLIYLMVYATLIATLGYDTYSLDYWRRMAKSSASGPSTG